MPCLIFTIWFIVPCLTNIFTLKGYLTFILYNLLYNFKIPALSAQAKNAHGGESIASGLPTQVCWGAAQLSQSSGILRKAPPVQQAPVRAQRSGIPQRGVEGKAYRASRISLPTDLHSLNQLTDMTSIMLPAMLRSFSLP